MHTCSSDDTLLWQRSSPCCRRPVCVVQERHMCSQRDLPQPLAPTLAAPACVFDPNRPVFTPCAAWVWRW